MVLFLTPEVLEVTDRLIPMENMIPATVYNVLRVVLFTVKTGTK
nr:MAG TPA: hypothetical protein [Caudoviricetes sp.]